MKGPCTASFDPHALTRAGVCVPAGKECQTAHWKSGGHKGQCKSLAVTSLTETLISIGGESAVLQLWGMKVAASAGSATMEKLTNLSWTLRGANRNMVRLHLACAIGES